MLTTVTTLGSLIDRTLLELQGPAETGRRIVLGATALTGTSDTQFLLSGDEVNTSDIIEFGDELVLVTGKTDDVDPTYTCARGYYGTTADSHVVGTTGTVNPSWPRIRVAEALRRAFTRMEAMGVPLVISQRFNRTIDTRYVELPAGTKDVYGVGYLSADGRFWEISNWRFFGEISTSTIGTGKILRLPWYVADGDDLEITYRTSYHWSSYPSPPDTDSTIPIPEGCEDLPCAYAAAWMLSAREISRTDIDRSEEWNRGEPARGGISLSLVRAKWQEFYRALDEARRVNYVPITRPYIKAAKI